ncbi:MAG TPA: TspO/MBR family protein [Methanoregulaceae archaeon]|nr:TspO/MBR family protein [Methanoregulaceae archaeon]
MAQSAARTYGLLILCIAIPLTGGIIGSIFTVDTINTWYVNLNKPLLTPPSWAFAPAWIVLYVLMGMALFLIVKDGFRTPEIRNATIIFAAQLVMNILWSFLFFGLHSPLYGLAGIIILLCLIVATIVAFNRIRKLAAWLLVPYILWVCFATYLNVMILILN